MTAMLDIFRALSDVTRLRILFLLRAMELAVGEVAQVVGQSQPRVSRHIRILVDAGLAERRKEGSWVFLRLTDTPQSRAISALLDEGALSEGESLWIKADLARLAAVRADRAAAAERYFAERAEEWDAIRSLHVADSAVEAAMAELLEGTDLGRLADIGTGTGRMIELFGAKAAHVTAVDLSPDMLRLARVKLPEDAIGKYDLRLGDFNALPLGDNAHDTLILHQVLHFAQAPEQVIAEAARVLRPGGRILIADFAPHDHEYLRTRDAHARLGFSDRQIESWFTASGFQLAETRELPGAELTVKLWLGCKRAGQVLPFAERA